MPDQPPTQRGGWGGARPGPHPGAPRRYVRLRLIKMVRETLDDLAKARGETPEQTAVACLEEGMLVLIARSYEQTPPDH